MKLKSTIIEPLPLRASAQDWNPAPHQEHCVKFLLKNAAGGILIDPGMRKTSIALATFLLLKKKRIVLRMLVVAPVRPCYLVWPKEGQKWKEFSGLRFVILHDDQDGKKEDKIKQDADIYVINPEGLGWLAKKGRARKLNAQVLCIDESSMFKRAKTVRFKALKKVMKYIDQRRWILTGSPAPNGLMDLFGQIWILDYGRALGEYISHYRMKYFSPSGYGGFNWQINEGADKLIHKKIKHLTVSMKAEDHIKMPQLVNIKVDVELPPKAMEKYREMEQELITQVEGNEVTAFNAGTSMGKCSQIANGTVYDENKKKVQVHTAKEEAVQEIVHELNGQPVLIAYEYDHDRDALLRVFGKDTPDLGRCTMRESIKLEAAWNRGELPILIGQPASVGHGLNLQESGNHIIWFSLIWNYEHYDQFIRRIRRSGQKAKRVFVHHLVAANTVDEVKMQVLEAKGNTQNALFSALKTYLKSKKTSNIRRK